MKICSFLPSGTEMVCYLGLENSLVGITHECDFPTSIKNLPKIVFPRFDSNKLTQSEMDRSVSEAFKNGESLYQIDEKKVLELQPDLIVTQNLCQVCAATGNQAVDVVKKLSKSTKILYMTPHNISEVLDNLVSLGEVTGLKTQAEKKRQELEQRIQLIQTKTINLKPKRVFFIEWLDPIFSGGHWIDEMIRIAGGKDPFTNPNQESIRKNWNDILQYDPEILLVSPCGYSLKNTIALAQTYLKNYENIQETSAYKNNQIYALDANGYFARPAPRLIDGIEILAEIFHPEIFSNAQHSTHYKNIQLL